MEIMAKQIAMAKQIGGPKPVWVPTPENPDIQYTRGKKIKDKESTFVNIK